MPATHRADAVRFFEIGAQYLERIRGIGGVDGQGNLLSVLLHQSLVAGRAVVGCEVGELIAPTRVGPQRQQERGNQPSDQAAACAACAA